MDAPNTKQIANGGEELDIKDEIVKPLTKHKSVAIFLSCSLLMPVGVAVDHQLQNGIRKKTILKRQFLMLLGTFALILPPFLTMLHM